MTVPHELLCPRCGDWCVPEYDDHGGGWVHRIRRAWTSLRPCRAGRAVGPHWDAQCSRCDLAFHVSSENLDAGMRDREIARAEREVGL